MRPRPLAAISASSNLLAVSFPEAQARGEGLGVAVQCQPWPWATISQGLSFCCSELAQASLGKGACRLRLAESVSPPGLKRAGTKERTIN